MILDKMDEIGYDIPIKEVEMAYKNIWEMEDGFKTLGRLGILPRAENSILTTPITKKEVVDARNKMKMNTAPGPDKVKVGAMNCGTRADRNWRPSLTRCCTEGKW